VRRQPAPAPVAPAPAASPLLPGLTESSTIPTV
jgi:hypothetical protein